MLQSEQEAVLQAAIQGPAGDRHLQGLQEHHGKHHVLRSMTTPARLPSTMSQARSPWRESKRKKGAKGRQSIIRCHRRFDKPRFRRVSGPSTITGMLFFAARFISSPKYSEVRCFISELFCPTMCRQYQRILKEPDWRVLTGCYRRKS